MLIPAEEETETVEEEAEIPAEEENDQETALDLLQTSESVSVQFPDVRSVLRLDGSASEKPFKAILVSSVPFVFGSAVHFRPQDYGREPSVPPDNVVVSLIKESDDPYFKG